MNKKHLATIVIAFLAVLFVEGYLQSRKRLETIQTELTAAQSAASAQDATMEADKAALAEMQKNAATTLAFLNSWSGVLGIIDSPEDGELTLASRVKQAGLIVIAQRFESVANKNDTIPSLIRAHLTFEGDFVKTLNWLGKVEEDLPTSRVTNLNMIRGETGNDVRINLVLDLPVIKKDALTTP